MAFTRNFLKSLGLTDEQVGAVIEAHTEVTDVLKQYKDDAEKLAGVQAQLDEANQKIADGAKDSWKVKYDALKEDFDTYKTVQETEKTHAAKEAVYRELLKTAGIAEKHIDKVLRVSDIDGLKLGGDGKAEGGDSIIGDLKTEWADFIVTESQRGTPTATPPANTGGKFDIGAYDAVSDADYYSAFYTNQKTEKGV